MEQSDLQSKLQLLEHELAQAQDDLLINPQPDLIGSPDYDIDAQMMYEYWKSEHLKLITGLTMEIEHIKNQLT